MSSKRTHNRHSLNLLNFQLPFPHTTIGGIMSLRLAYDTTLGGRIWCVVLDCTREVIFYSASYEQCKDKYPEAVRKG